MSWPRCVGLALLGLGCGDGFVASPFVSADAGDAGLAAPPARDAGVVPLPVPRLGPGQALGGPCLDDAQCLDEHACTAGTCDPELGACVFSADHAACDDGVYCNGEERCDPRLGCRPGPPTSCSDATPCTVDACDEATRSCVRTERDLDADGDPDGNCTIGRDCDDLDPRVSSQELEVCGNGVDDDCDGASDETECTAAQFDACDDVLDVSAPGSYLLAAAGALLDYGGACASASPAARDLVLQVTVPEAGTSDVELVARTSRGTLAMAQVNECGETASATACTKGGVLASGEAVARLRLSGSAPGTHAVYVFSDTSGPIHIERSDVDVQPPLGNLQCADAIALAPAVEAVADMAISGEPSASACATDRADRFYAISLAEPQDLLVFARSLDGLGQPRLSLREPACDAPPGQEIGCERSATATLRRHSLAAGDYVLAVSATGPSRIGVTLELREPTPAPASDRCESAPALPLNLTEPLSFVGHVDDIAAGCNPGYVDAARRIELAAPSDLLLIGRFSSNDAAAISLAQAGCATSGVLACSAISSGAARATLRGVAPGTYWVVAESLAGLPATVTAAARPAQPVTLVPGADRCSEALLVGPSGGFFRGNTTNALNDLTASCDFATPAPAPEQVLRLVLDRDRRVVLDARGSEYDVLLNVRRGPNCPGEEVEGACIARTAASASFLDRDLPAGEYFIQIDGYAGASGPWSLDVFLLDPG